MKHLSLLSQELIASKTTTVVTDFCWNVVESLFSENDSIPLFTLHCDMEPYTNIIEGVAEIVNSKFPEWYIIEQDTLKVVASMLCSMDIKESKYFNWMTNSLTNVLQLRLSVKDGLLNLDELERIKNQHLNLNRFLEAVVPHEKVQGLLFKMEDINSIFTEFQNMCSAIQSLLFNEVPLMDPQYP